MRIIEIKTNGKWTYTKIVKNDQSNKIVRALNKEGHTARSIPAPSGHHEKIDKLMSAPHALTKPERKKLKKMIGETKPASFPKSMRAKPSRMRQAAPDVTLLSLNDVVNYPTLDDITKAVEAVVKAARPKVDLTAVQLAAMLKIEGAGRMEDPRRCELNIHAATLRALVSRGSVIIGLNDSVHLTIAGRRALLGAVAKIVAPNAERRELVAA